MKEFNTKLIKPVAAVMLLSLLMSSCLPRRPRPPRPHAMEKIMITPSNNNS